MQPKLRLVRESHLERERAEAEEEDRYRYPPHEEVWEVSCGSEWENDEKPTRTNDQRRAS